ncbi:MAG: type II/IV secretion system protein [Deltaproteobacteria bacterium]|nr:type II/IV secretion system protein [Deltaproteobacteria bacterium]
MNSRPPETSPRAPTIVELLDALVGLGHLKPLHRDEIAARAVQQRAHLQRQRLAARFHGAEAHEPTDAEVIASFHFPLATDASDHLDEDRVVEVRARMMGVPYAHIDPLKLSPDLITSTVSRPFARRHCVVPLESGDGTIRVAMADPFDEALIDELERITGRRVEALMASRKAIQKIITEVYGFQSSVSAAEEQVRGGDKGPAQPGVDLGNLEQYFRLKKVDEIEATDRHVVNAVEYLLHYAFDNRASDIHVEPRREEGVVRMRIDGVLHEVYRIPKVVLPAIVSRIKMMSRMDVAERRKPQDGRIKTAAGAVGGEAREVELRVSTLPAAFGEKIVLRIFDPEQILVDLPDLGMYPEELEAYERFITRPNGLLLVTGPTGSGKTTTLYSTLRAIATPQVNVVTIEDPIEMVVEEFNQVAVQHKIDVTFPTMLRTFLRQDPDIIMVGEIRDAETAEYAVQAALTGHLVLSTLHTNDSPSTIVRLRELGVDKFLVNSTLVGVVAQRLARKVCQNCKVEETLTADQVALLEIPMRGGRPPELKVARGEGCPRCRGTGLFGRTGIFEVLDVTDGVRRLVAEEADAASISRQARADGMRTLREVAVHKLAAGITSFSEVVRVTVQEESR